MAKVLVVEDDLDILDLVMTRLKGAGHQVIAAKSPQVALERVKENLPIDLAVLDVGLPDMTGIELLEQLRNGDLPGVPAIFLSARVEAEDVEAGEAAGAIYLTKPFVTSAFLQAVEHSLESSG